MNKLSVEEYLSQIEQLCESNYELKAFVSPIRDLTDLMKYDSFRSKLSVDHWKPIVETTKIIQKFFDESKLDDEKLDLLAQFLRLLRNSCAGSAQNQHFILNSSEILSCVKKTLSCFKEKKSIKEVTVFKCCLQVFGNLVCVNDNAKSIVWTLFLEESILKHLFEHENSTVKEYAMMVLYNCMYDEPVKYLIEARSGRLILIALLDSLCDDLVDWGIMFLEYILKKEDFMKKCYEMLPLRSRLLILDVITEQLSNDSENSYSFVSNSTIIFIQELFIEYVMNIMQLCSTESDEMKPVEEIVKVLCLLCEASVSCTYSHILKSSRQLLETSLDTLRSVHLLGKKSSNAFSSISNTKVTNEITKKEIEDNPSYGFKKNLIRLIGNVCYNCTDNQDLLRKLDGIPLLLDCCNLDARNPFIMQWCILAMRNILEKNAENQAILAGVSITGDLADSALIKELGFEVKSEKGKFVLKSLHPLNSS